MPSDSVRVSIAWSPAEPQFSAVIKASKAVTALYDNDNMIDATRFPPHASVHICSIPRSGIAELARLILESVGSTPKILPVLAPDRVIAGSGGYVSVGLEITDGVMVVHESVLSAVAHVRGADYDELPYWIRQASAADQENYSKYGNIYVREKFDLHYSVAKVDQHDQQAAKAIVEGKLSGLEPVAAAALQICDIGARSEKWEVLGEV